MVYCNYLLQKKERKKERKIKTINKNDKNKECLIMIYTKSNLDKQTNK